MFQDEFEKMKVANLERESETQKKSEDELFCEIVGGGNEKGRIFGLDEVAHSYYDRPTYEERNSKKSRRDYIKNQIKQELDQTEKELDETKQGLVETQTNLIRTQNVLLETIKTRPKTTESFKTASGKVYAS
ncbi:TPT1-like protein [Bienertia sinuspersici]